MPKSISWKKLIQKFHNLGFDGPYSGGRHPFMVRGELKIHIPNQHHNDISKHLVSEIINQANISKEDWKKV